MQGTQIHDGKFFNILWDAESHIIGIDWKESTAEMSEEDFKADLTTFAGYVEQRGEEVAVGVERAAAFLATASRSAGGLSRVFTSGGGAQRCGGAQHEADPRVQQRAGGEELVTWPGLSFPCTSARPLPSVQHAAFVTKS